MKRHRIYINASGARRLGVRRGYATATIVYDGGWWFATDIRRGTERLSGPVGLSSLGWRARA